MADCLRFLVLEALDATDLSRVNLVHVEVRVLLQLVLANAAKAKVHAINFLSLGLDHKFKLLQR